MAFLEEPYSSEFSGAELSALLVDRGAAIDAPSVIHSVVSRIEEYGPPWHPIDHRLLGELTKKVQASASTKRSTFDLEEHLNKLYMAALLEIVTPQQARDLRRLSRYLSQATKVQTLGV